jgi:hypothetical protein
LSETLLSLSSFPFFRVDSLVFLVAVSFYLGSVFLTSPILEARVLFSLVLMGEKKSSPRISYILPRFLAIVSRTSDTPSPTSF